MSIICNIGIAQEIMTREKRNFNDNWKFFKADYLQYSDIINTTQQ